MTSLLTIALAGEGTWGWEEGDYLVFDRNGWPEFYVVTRLLDLNTLAIRPVGFWTLLWFTLKHTKWMPESYYKDAGLRTI